MTHCSSLGSGSGGQAFLVKGQRVNFSGLQLCPGHTVVAGKPLQAQWRCKSRACPCLPWALSHISSSVSYADPSFSCSLNTGAPWGFVFNPLYLWTNSRIISACPETVFLCFFCFFSQTFKNVKPFLALKSYKDRRWAGCFAESSSRCGHNWDRNPKINPLFKSLPLLFMATAVV